jgi:hypothetical protein
MKALPTLRRTRISALLLVTALSLGALAAPQPAEACGPYGPVLSPEEREVVFAARGRLPADGTVYVLSYGKVRIEEDRALVSLELYDDARERSYWRTFRFVRGDDGWKPAPRRHA